MRIRGTFIASAHYDRGFLCALARVTSARRQHALLQWGAARPSKGARRLLAEGEAARRAGNFRASDPATLAGDSR